MKEQYKDTEIGVIPSDWELVHLGEVFKKIVVGFVGSVSEYYCPKDEGILFLRTKNIKENKLSLKGVEYVTKEFASKNSKSNLENGDIIVARVGITGTACMIRGLEEPANCANVIILKKEENVNSLFFDYLINSWLIQKQIKSNTAGGVQLVFNTSLSKKLIVPLPSKKEQQKIAQILSAVDEQISTTQTIIDKSKELKKGLMQKLFSEGIGHTEFKDTKIGKIPKDWEVSKLGANCIKSSKKIEPSQSDDSFRYIGLEHIISDAHRIKGYGYSNDTLSTKTIFNEGDILYGKLRPYLNKVWRAQFSGVCTTEILVLKSKRDFDNGFLYFLLQSHKFIGHTISHTEGTSLPRANWKDIIKFKIPLPSLSEQQKIADILSQVDAKIEKEEHEKTQLEQLKKGLMQQLLTGQKRVKV